MDIATEFLSAAINAFEANKHLADRAVEQVSDDKLHVALDPNTNCIAVIMKHVAGNRPRGENPCWRPVENADDPQGRFRAIQQGQLGADGEIAFVAPAHAPGAITLVLAGGRSGLSFPTWTAHRNDARKSPVTASR